jgi:hypothetical protein
MDNFECCRNVKKYFVNNSLPDLQFYIKYIHEKKQTIADNLSSISGTLKKIQTEYIEEGSKMINPICQIIAEYTERSHLKSYAIFQNDDTIKLYLYLDNEFRTTWGMGGLSTDCCYLCNLIINIT